MIYQYIQDEGYIERIIDLFIEFVKSQQHGREVSFTDRYGYLWKEEGYKRTVSLRGAEILGMQGWNTMDPEEITRRVILAIDMKENNLVDYRHKDTFRKKLRENPIKSGLVMKDFFSSDIDGETAFEEMVSFLDDTRHYDVLSWLFYMKDSSVYYPCRSGNFKDRFEDLGIVDAFSSRATYRNYCAFNEAIREVATLFSSYAFHISAIDAHSFVWVVGNEHQGRPYIFGDSSRLDNVPGGRCLEGSKKEGLSVTKTRLNQTQYRRDMMAYWGGRCAVTGCGQTDLLITSHAKPWRACMENDESANFYNGLLLMPHLDALFDAGYISFDDEGHMIVSDLLDEQARKDFGLHAGMHLRKMAPEHVPFLRYHREYVFKRK